MPFHCARVFYIATETASSPESRTHIFSSVLLHNKKIPGKYCVFYIHKDHYATAGVVTIQSTVYVVLQELQLEDCMGSVGTVAHFIKGKDNYAGRGLHFRAESIFFILLAYTTTLDLCW